MLAQRGEIGTVEFTREVLDRVVDGRGVGLDRDLVVVSDVREPQCGHDRHHGCARRLVPADLHVRCLATVGMVDDPCGEPEHPLFDFLQGCEVGS